MPAASIQQLPIGPNAGMGDERRSADWGDLTIDYASFPPHNLAPMLKGMLNDRCQCPHWGFLFKGKIVVRYADHEEMIEAGQAFYMAPGHAPEALEECELIQFSPTEQRNDMVAVMSNNARAMHKPS